jgi:alcohol dehydrogenase (cytochrome c)
MIRRLPRKADLLLLFATSLLPLSMAAQAPATQDLAAQGPASGGLDPATLLKPATDSWPTYAGDYSQRRFSPLTQINQGNVKNLALQWVGSLPVGAPTPGGGGFFGGPQIPTSIGGEIPEAVPVAGWGTRISGAILQVDGILYMSAPDNAWAMDARTGQVLWHYFWKTRGGTHIGNRGMAMYHDWLYFETPDDYLVSLDAKTGKERWHKEIADFNQEYFSTPAPILVGNHLLVGTGDDLDAPGFLQAFDPVTGDLQWKYYTVPMEKGDPGLDTWATLDAARHGGAQVWIPGAYDPDTHLYIFPTGNPTPAYTPATRGDKANLYTCSIIGINVDTGKMAWYYQTSPGDTHDWDSTQSPILVDGVFNGKPRKMVMQAARNGYFFVVDRTTGEHLLTSKFSESANWAKGVAPDGSLIRNPDKDSSTTGVLVSPDNGGATNWWPPAFSPQTGYFYLQSREVYSMYYLTESNARVIAGLGGKEEDAVGSHGASLLAIDYKTGKIAWKYRYPSTDGSGFGVAGLLTTAGKLLFSTDTVGSIAAYDPANGHPLWHARIGGVSNAPETYLLDGRQYMIVAAGTTIYAFALNQ